MNISGAGDAVVDALLVMSPRGVASFAHLVQHISVFESIFQPAVVADITILDFDSVIGNMILVGDETVYLQFSSNRGTAKYNFALNQVDGIESPSMKCYSYILRCVSIETLYAKTNYVQKSYETLISSMVADIQSTYLQSSRSIYTEPTDGPQRIVIPNYSPYQAIDMLRRRSVSALNKSSMFIYYETQKQFNFRTIEGLFQQGITKTYFQSDTVGQSINIDITDNILAYTVPQLTSSIDRIKYGMKKRVIQFNFRTHKFDMKDVDTADTSMASGGTGSYNSAEFIAKFASGAKIPPFTFVPTDTSARPVTGISEASANFDSYLATLMQNVMTIKSFGDPNIVAGDLIYLAIHEKNSTTDRRELDKLLSGKFMITRLHHEIGNAAATPRYTNTLELVKGGLENGV